MENSWIAMNYQSTYQSPLGGMDYQFQNLGIHGSGRGTPVSGVVGGSGGGSLLDSIGTQRTGSPFVGQQQFGAGRGPAAVNGWGSGLGGDVALHESASSSPYASQMGTPSLIGGTAKLAGPSLPQRSGLIPGLGTLPTTLESQWRYVDTQGQIQGPFGSISMSQWYASGYFQQTLQISRVGTSFEPFGINDTFITLGDLLAKVNDFQDPFTAFDRIVASVTSVASPMTVPAAVGGEGIGMSLLQQQPVSKQTPVATVDSSDFTHEQILGLEDSDGGRYREVVVQIPVSKKNFEKLESDVEVDTTIPSGQKEVISKPIVPEAEEAETVAQQSEPVTEQLAAAEPEVDEAKELELKRQRKAEEMAKKLLEEQQKLEEEQMKKEELRKLKKQQKQKSKQQKPETKVGENGDKQVVEGEITIESTAPKAPVAPWAKKNTALETPRISILELQRKEEQELAKREQERERAERAVAQKLQEQILKEDKAQKELKSVLTWANKPTPPPVAVDLKPSQSKNTALNNSLKNSLTPVAKTEAPEEFSDPNFLKEQAKLWESAQRDKARRQATTTATTTYTKSNGNDWTTITSKSTNNVNNSSQPKVVNQPKSYISPDKLRAVGGTSNKQIGSSTSIPSLKAKYTAPVTYPGNNSISVRQEFLRWCKSQMKLNPNVETKSVLEVLLSLPAGPEAKEIIADTIYSNSGTMDGRRFATEFIKRRVECEKLVKDPLTWSEALALPEGNEDDWEFQVVSKKKGRKHRVD